MEKKEKTKTSTNLKKGKFTREELKLYNLNDKEINIILEYQELLPVLQQDNGDWIDARILHEQLVIKSKFADWIKNRIDKYEFIDNVDFITVSKILENGGKSIEYSISVEMAKQLTMVERSKIGTIARKYFIYIEKAFKGRYDWNLDRDETLIKCKALKRALIKYSKPIIERIPDYFHNNKFIAEFCLLNEVIIGMTAKEYRRRKGYSDSYPIRNSFTEKELENVHVLEQYDADLIEVQNEFNYEKRKEYLSKKFELMI